MTKTFLSAIARTVSLISHDVDTLIDTLSHDFASDFGHFARSNNRDRLEQGIATLVKAKPLHAAIIAAITEGVKAGALVQGYIGARTGAYDKQDADTIAPFESAMVKAGEAFTASLTSSPALQPKAPRTKEEKETLKAEKAQKAIEAGEALITAKIQAGELIRADQVRPFPQEEIDAFKLLVATLQAENATLQAENATLQAENATLQAENATLQAVKGKKQKVAA